MGEVEVLLDGMNGFGKWMGVDGIWVGDFVIGLEGFEEGLQIIGDGENWNAD